MILFKPYHVPLILLGKKTETRRLWPHGRRVKPGSIHSAKTTLFGEPFATLSIINVYQQKLGEMTERDARAEGGYTLRKYRQVFRRINGFWDPAKIVYAVKFSLYSGVCQRCGTRSDRFYPFTDIDEDTGKSSLMAVCWDCDFDIINGRGTLHDDPGEIQMDRWEEEYEFDPVNTTPPPWLR
jgi:hypothetical protein